MIAVMGAGAVVCAGASVWCVVQGVRLGRARDALGSAREFVEPRPVAEAASVHVPSASGLWASRENRQVGLGPDSPMEFPAGSPPAVRELLNGVGDSLLSEAASAVVRGDERNAQLLVWLDEQARSVRDAICD